MEPNCTIVNSASKKCCIEYCWKPRTLQCRINRSQGWDSIALNQDNIVRCAEAAWLAKVGLGVLQSLAVPCSTGTSACNDKYLVYNRIMIMVMLAYLYDGILQLAV